MKITAFLIFGILVASILVISFIDACPCAGASQKQVQDQIQKQFQAYVQNQLQNQSGNWSQEVNYIIANGTQLMIKKQAKNKTQLKIKNIIAYTELNITWEQIQEKIHNKTQNRTKIHVNLSNGRWAEIKIMPDTASETALSRLRLKVCNESNNCTIVLKEVGQREQIKAAYELQAERHAKLLGFFRLKMQVKAQVDAETGELIRVKKPWWAFLAAESEEGEGADEEPGDEDSEDNETAEPENNETAEE